MRVIHILRKPLSEGTVAANTLKHGTGGINIGASRVAHANPDDLEAHRKMVEAIKARGGSMDNSWKNSSDLSGANDVPTGGRWPANVILQHLDGCRCEGTKQVKCSNPDGTIRHGDNEVYSKRGGIPLSDTNHANPEGKESVANGICVPDCPVRALDEQSGGRKTTRVSPKHANNREGGFLGALGHPGGQGYNDNGGASRFYKQVGGKKDA